MDNNKIYNIIIKSPNVWNIFILDYYLDFIKRATGPVLISDKEEKHVILPTILNFDVRRGKLRIYTFQNPSDVFWKFAPPEVYKECAVVCFA